jgi:hypothetical protein
MRARAAYISSFGTTSILLAGTLLMLALVSALVAFRGWPESASGLNVPSVPLEPPSNPTGTVIAIRHAEPSVIPIKQARKIGRVASRTSAKSKSTAGLVKVVEGGGPATVGAAPVPAAPAPPQRTVPSTPHTPPTVGDPSPAPLLPSEPDVGGIVGGTIPPLPQPQIGLPQSIDVAGITIPIGT